LHIAMPDRIAEGDERRWSTGWIDHKQYALKVGQIALPTPNSIGGDWCAGMHFDDAPDRPPIGTVAL
jgi:hypothetical protein